jgi:hypothetical protein
VSKDLTEVMVYRDLGSHVLGAYLHSKSEKNKRHLADLYFDLDQRSRIEICKIIEENK